MPELSQEPFVMFVCQHYTAFIFSSLKSDCLKPDTVIIYLHIPRRKHLGLVNIQHRFLHWLSLPCSFHIRHVLWACVHKMLAVLSTVTLQLCNGLIFILIHSWWSAGGEYNCQALLGFSRATTRALYKYQSNVFIKPQECKNEYWRRNNAHVPSNGKKGAF